MIPIFRIHCIKILVLLVLFSPLSGTAVLLAEPVVDPLELGMLDERLASLPSANETPQLINRDNIGEFHRYLPSPVVSLITRGLIEIEAVNGLNFSWSKPGSADVVNEEKESKLRFTTDFQLPASFSPEKLRDLPFGKVEQLHNEVDPVVKAYKVLWNSLAQRARAERLLYQVELLWFLERSLERSAIASFLQDFGLQSLNEQEQEQEQEDVNQFLLAEILRIHEPGIAQDLTFGSKLAVRKEQDSYWIYSPATKHLRQIYSSNRADPLLGGPVSFDDFFVSSENPNTLHARVMEQRRMLVPFLALSEYPTVGKDYEMREPVSAGVPELVGLGQGQSSPAQTLLGGTRLSDGRQVLASFNFEHITQATRVHWAPNYIVFVARPVWLIEISSKDPFYPHGRSVVIVDQRSMLPVYKLVFDKHGSLTKTVIGAWGRAAESEAVEGFPFLGLLLVLKQEGNKEPSVTAWRTLSLSLLQGEMPNGYQHAFSPERYPKHSE